MPLRSAYLTPRPSVPPQQTAKLYESAVSKAVKACHRVVMNSIITFWRFVSVDAFTLASARRSGQRRLEGGDDLPLGEPPGAVGLETGTESGALVDAGVRQDPGTRQLTISLGASRDSVCRRFPPIRRSRFCGHAQFTPVLVEAGWPADRSFWEFQIGGFHGSNSGSRRPSPSHRPARR